jgi:ABC-type glutathione transport system ATPase component
MPEQSMVVLGGDRELSRRAPGAYAENAYQSESYMSALQETREGLCRGEAIIVITGRSGTGKTLLCRTLAEMGDPRTFTPPKGCCCRSCATLVSWTPQRG